MADNIIIGDGIWLKFNLIQAFIGVLITCKNEEDPSKNEGTITLVNVYVNLLVFMRISVTS